MKVLFSVVVHYNQSHIADVFSKIKSTSHCGLDIRNEGATLLRDACGALGSKGSSVGVFNSLPWERHEVIQIQDRAGKYDLVMLDILSIFTKYTIFMFLQLHVC